MSRKNFVAWYIRENPLTLNLLRRSQQNPEIYEWIGTEMEWQAWKAATEEQAEQLTIAKQRIAQLEKDCDILKYNLDEAHKINKNQIQNCEAAYKYAFSMRDLVIARDAEIERLKSAKHMIVSCADRMPTDDDADYNGQVWAMCGNEWHLLCYSNPMFADGRAKMWAATGLEKPEIDLRGRNE